MRPDGLFGFSVSFCFVSLCLLVTPFSREKNCPRSGTPALGRQASKASVGLHLFFFCPSHSVGSHGSNPNVFCKKSKSLEKKKKEKRLGMKQ
ncbi:hypothetical protein LZ31DRAFT_86343 [Colletotrichum somersetense]|nr:hypothetical protein LZ31DRAFT_86343 [Colletotrichum somersetense]